MTAAHDIARLAAMRKSLSLAAALLAAATIVHADPASLPAADRAAIVVAPAATAPQLRVAEIPASIRAIAFPYMADPGQPFQVADTISPGDNQPGGRLVWGVRIGRLYVLHSEFGGIAHGFQVRVYELGPAAAKQVWGAYGPRYATFVAFQAALRSGRLAATS